MAAGEHQEARAGAGRRRCSRHGAPPGQRGACDEAGAGRAGHASDKSDPIPASGPAAHAGEDGLVSPEVICAALDCPGQFAWLAEGTRTGLLGRLTARVERPVRAGTPCVVIGWTMGNEGRKYYAGTALFDQDRQLCAYAKAVWIGRAQ